MLYDNIEVVLKNNINETFCMLIILTTTFDTFDNIIIKIKSYYNNFTDNEKISELVISKYNDILLKINKHLGKKKIV